ncbi:MAG: K(+)-transporting ATPase subunit C [Acidobacteria bacterium]|nr:K(+)-transporting ATPase subunit C [Acidobacteriota bacterium]
MLVVALLSILLGGIYPLAIWGIGQLLFPWRANGSLLEREQKIGGSTLVGQPFTSPSYFHPRPSAIDFAVSGVKSGGSNLGPLSRRLREQAVMRIRNYRQENRLPAAARIAADAVSASASGLDPHISPADAMVQAARVAKARGLQEGQVLQMVQQVMEGRQLGIFGEKRVNVLLLNLALDSREP